MIPFQFHKLMLKVLARHLDYIEIKTTKASFYVFVAALKFQIYLALRSQMP